MTQKSHREEAFGPLKKGAILWCLHCERTYEKGKWRTKNGLQMCPYADCDGDAVIDAWPWETVKEANPSYPAIPTAGSSYPLYGSK